MNDWLRSISGASFQTERYSEIDLSASVPALEMAEALYLGAGSAALAALTEKLDTGGHELTDAERQYVERVRYWLNSLLDEEARLEKLGALPKH